MNPLDELMALAAAPYTRTDDRKLIGVFPAWFPNELLIAAGLRASEWWGFPVPSTAADKHFPAYVCSLVKSNFEVLLDGAADCDGMIFPATTCDSIQNSAGLFRRLFPNKFAGYFRMTQNPESRAAAEYVRSEILRLHKEISTYAGKTIGDDDLRQAIRSVNRYRQAARALLGALQTGMLSVRASVIYTALRGAAADVGEKSAALLEQAHKEIISKPMTGPRLLLVGMVADPVDIMDVIEDAKAQVAGDDLALGWRTVEIDVAEDGDPIEALVQRLLNSNPCSSLHFRDKSRADYVLKRAREVEAQGVIFTRLKFCDPEAFDYPAIKSKLDQAGLPSLLLERELTGLHDGAAATRVEAFIEQIG